MSMPSIGQRKIAVGDLREWGCQTRSGGPGLVRSGSGLKYRCRCLADRGDSASGQVGPVSPRPREGCIAAALLGVVELWLSQARLETVRTGVWSYAAARIRLAQP